MRFVGILAVCLLALVSAALANDAAAPSDVVVLSTSTFDQNVKDGVWLVEFFAPWCGHCKSLAPTWADLAKNAKADGKFHVASVDCTVEKELATRFGIRGFPTIKLIAGGKVYTYRGQRTVQDFTAFATGGYTSGAEVADFPAAGAGAPAPAPATEAPKAPAPAPAEASDVVVLTDNTFKETVASGAWLIKFYAPWCGHCKRLVPTWDELATQQKTAKKFNVAKVDCTVEKAVCKEQGVGGYPTIKLFSDGKLVAPYDSARTLAAFTEWVDKKLAPKTEL